jgi:eukaryotic-like serine/threonine-protein kinase
VVPLVRFGRYTVDPDNVKEGGQAFVYFAVDPRDGTRVAIKVSRPSDWSRKRMKREIGTQLRLDHPNILPVREHAEDFSWYATDQAECSLDGLGPFTRAQWMHFRAGMLGVVSAVGYAHRKRLIHRDLSPGNILVFAAGWTVSDWDFVHVPPKAGPRMTEPLERFGTPDFMAPELAADPRDVGPAADIYALGRIAAWGTMLKPGEGTADDHPFTAWWRLLIDHTTAYDPARRWTIQDVHAHLRLLPPRHVQLRLDEPRFDAPLVASRVDVCPNCQRDLGRDRAEHCLACHAPLPD